MSLKKQNINLYIYFYQKSPVMRIQMTRNKCKQKRPKSQTCRKHPQVLPRNAFWGCLWFLFQPSLTSCSFQLPSDQFHLLENKRAFSLLEQSPTDQGLRSETCQSQVQNEDSLLTMWAHCWGTGEEACFHHWPSVRLWCSVSNVWGTSLNQQTPEVKKPLRNFLAGIKKRKAASNWQKHWTSRGADQDLLPFLTWRVMYLRYLLTWESFNCLLDQRFSATFIGTDPQLLEPPSWWEALPQTEVGHPWVKHELRST